LFKEKTVLKGLNNAAEKEIVISFKNQNKKIQNSQNVDRSKFTMLTSFQ